MRITMRLQGLQKGNERKLQEAKVTCVLKAKDNVRYEYEHCNAPR